MQISPRHPNQPAATVNPQSGIADIKTNAALFEWLMDAKPELPANANAFFVRLNQLVASNDDTLQRSLSSLASFPAVLEPDKDELDKTIKNVNAITESFRSAAAPLDSTIVRIDGDLPDGDDSNVAHVRTTVVALRAIAEELIQMIDGNVARPMQAAKRSLKELEQLAKHRRRALRGIDRIIVKVDRAPQSLLFGSTTAKPCQPQ